MLITYNADGTPARSGHGRKIAALMVLNAAFAMTVIFGWTLVSLFMAEPMHWATWYAVSRGSTILEMFYYPFSLLWLLPSCGIMGAWVALKSKKPAIAYAFVLLPLLFMVLIFGWYYFTPEDWR